MRSSDSLLVWSLYAARSLRSSYGFTLQNIVTLKAVALLEGDVFIFAKNIIAVLYDYLFCNGAYKERCPDVASWIE